MAQAVSDPHSSSYGHYLTPAQFRQQFAPSQAQVGAVQSWLRSQGFSVEYTPTNNHYVSAEGTVAQAEAAFGTSFGMYSVQGLTVRSPSSDVSIPSSLAGIVYGIINSVFVQGGRERAISQPSGITYAIPAVYIHEMLRREKIQGIE